MTKYLAGVLSVIAAGVLLIAYGLLAPNAQASFDNRNLVPAGAYYAYPGDASQPAAYPAQPVYPSQAVPVSYVPMPMPMPMTQNADYRAVPVVQTIAEAPVRTVVREAPQRVQARTVVAKPVRNWKKSAMIIGGTSAAAAGVGGLIGGKKGALIGAAIGGGASTIYETQKDRR